MSGLLVPASGAVRSRILSILTIAIGAVTAVPARALQVAPLWNQSAGDASSQSSYDVAIDDVTGRTAITGGFAGTVNFGGGNMTSAGGNDGFIAVFEPDGSFLAQRQFGDAQSQYGMALDWSSDGNLFVTGYFAGTINLGGSNLVSAGGNDVFLARFDHLLTYIGASKFGDASSQIVSDLAVDDAKNVIITGYFQGTVNFGGTLLTSVGSNDVFLARFNFGLGHLWSSRFGDGGNQQGHGCDADAAGNVYACGYFTSSVNFGGSTLNNAGLNDAFVVKFNSSGTHQWSKGFGDGSNQLASKISASAAGEVYVTGYFAGGVNFGGSVLTSVGLDDVFLAKFSTGGVHQWSQRYGDASSQFGLSIDNDDTGVYISGQVEGAINFGGNIWTSFGGRDVFLARLTTAGVHVWSKIYGDDLEQYGFGVDLGVGRIGFTGYYQGEMNFAPGIITSAGGTDAFLLVASTNAIEPVIKSVTDVRNDQGRRARVRFERSGFDDAASADPVTAYEAYVEEPLLASDAGLEAGGPARSPQGGGVFIYVGSIPAHGETHYTMVIPTFADSNIVYGDYNTRVYIRVARASLPATIFSSALGTGSSIDNLAPGMSALRLDLTLLHWHPADAPDVDYYSVYGNSNEDFDGATLIDYTLATEFDITATPRAFYFVTATDFNGNESRASKVRVYTGIDGGPVARVLSISAFPNPFNPATTLRYTVPVRGRVQIDVYDARGSRVARLLDEDRLAGAYTAAWDGADANGGRASSGVYFARITQGADTRTYKLVLIK